MIELNDIENVFIILGISRPIPCRFIGKSKDRYIFEPLKVDFTQYKNGSKIVNVKDFKVSDLEIEGKKVLIIL
jgi:hypothetical protein